MAKNLIEHHMPYFAEGEVVSGFGRGSKELGIPTANFPETVIQQLPTSFECGVYYGWAKLSSNPQVFKMTMCVGWNPYYHNTVKTMETHIIHQFDSDFYGDIMKIIVLGFIRPMCDFPSLDALIKAIHNDIEVASNHLDTAESLKFKNDPFFKFQDSTANASDAMTPTSHTPQVCANVLSNDRKAATETNASVYSNGVYDTFKDNNLSSKGFIEGSKGTFSKEDLSKSTALISDSCKDSI